MDVLWMVSTMAENVHQLRPKPTDSEKITINLGYVDLGHIDLMVQDGFYSNRTDFIRTAIRNQLDRHADAVRKSVARKTLDLCLRQYSSEDLEAVRADWRAPPSPRSRCWARCTRARGQGSSKRSDALTRQRARHYSADRTRRLNRRRVRPADDPF